jgi:phosphopantetheinyl transferase (holo-ACP synthase)/acyl carrier protein
VHADRWTARIFTEAELRDCRVGTRLDPRRLGAGFAAKEAVIKVLAPARDEAIPWRTIEIRGGRVALDGPAARLAAASGLGRLDVSVTWAGDHAAAVVVAAASAGGGTPDALQVSSWSPTQPMNSTVNEAIRRVIGDHARLAVDPAALADDADLYEAGMTSHASVNVMLALEDAFDVEFPDRMLKRDVFESVERIAAAVTELREMAA